MIYIKRKKFYQLGLVLLISIILLVNKTDITTKNPLITIMFLGFMLIISLLLFIRSKKGYSLLDIYLIFMLLFFGYAPLLQYSSSDFPWYDDYLITDSLIMYMMFLVFLFTVLLLGAYFFGYKRGKKQRISKISVRPFTLDIGFILSIISTIIVVYFIGVPDIFFRSTSELSVDNSAIATIINNSIRGIPLIVLLLNMLYFNENGKVYRKGQFIIIVILFLLTHFPLGLPRYKFAATYISIFLIMKKQFSNKYAFKTIMIMGLIFVFPLINMFRYYDFNSLSNFTLNFVIYEDMFQGHYDAFSMFGRAISYTNNVGIEFGKQLLTVFLFFVPRSYWPGKSVGSGYLIAENLGWVFKNVSMPFIGEAYLNFGIFGVVLFGLGLGYVMGILDKKIDHLVDIKVTNPIIIYYVLIIGFLFFILRGDLLSSFAYTIGYLLPLFILLKINTIFKGWL